jgi:hypothetical protein
MKGRYWENCRKKSGSAKGCLMGRTGLGGRKVGEIRKII